MKSAFDNSRFIRSAGRALPVAGAGLTLAGHVQQGERLDRARHVVEQREGPALDHVGVRLEVHALDDLDLILLDERHHIVEIVGLDQIRRQQQLRDRTFREGRGQYVQQQGPYPQQLQADGVGHIVAQVGPQIGPCGFSSLAATREWLASDMAKAFTRAYRKTRKYMTETPAAEIARAEKPYFPNIDEKVLADCLATYQKLGCWTPHVEITKAAYEKTLDIFEFNGLLKQRYRYEQVCAAPPEAA